MKGELGRRVVSGLVLGVVVLAATWYGGLVFRLVVALCALLIYYEWATIVEGGLSSSRIGLFGWVVTLCCAALLVAGSKAEAIYVAVLGGAFSCGWGVLGKRGAWAGFGIFYAVLPAVALAGLRGDHFGGLIVVLVVFAVVWATDIGAYFAGRFFGGPKLAPRISPSKTWSGAVGGAVAAVVAGTAVASAFHIGASLWVPVFTLYMSIASQLGDLFESWVKRRFGVKDSGHIIPGHGGVMDRVDGLVFAAFAAYLIAVGLPGAGHGGKGGVAFPNNFLAAASLVRPTGPENGPAGAKEQATWKF